MRNLKTLSLVAAAFMASTAMTHAADLITTQNYDDQVVEITPHAVGGWYIRGDIGYASLDHNGVGYFQNNLFTGGFEQSELDSTWSIQGGIGYQVTDYFRVDGTLKYYGSADFDGSSAPGPTALCNTNGAAFGNFCSYNDDTEMESAVVLMANAYADLGTINGITPYVGAGIGGAHVSYGDLLNDQTCVGSANDPACSVIDFNHSGAERWRFAFALHAGASVDLTCKLKADAGYTFTRIEGGKMFNGGIPIAGGANAGGDGFDHGIDIHEGRVGLRYALGGGDCHPTTPPPVVYK